LFALEVTVISAEKPHYNVIGDASDEIVGGGLV
jgi:hypothetical protein